MERLRSCLDAHQTTYNRGSRLIAQHGDLELDLGELVGRLGDQRGERVIGVGLASSA